MESEKLDQLLERYDAQAATPVPGASSRWTAFSAAAGAAMTLSAGADAAVIYSGTVNKSVTGAGASTLVDFNGDGQDDLRLSILDTSGYLHGRGGMLNGNFQGPGQFIFSVFSTYLSSIPAGTPVAPWIASHTHNFNLLSYFGLLSATGFFGFQFTGTGGSYLGWMQLAATGPSSTLTLVDFAYNDTPDGPINAAQVPEPGSLALLASGVAGLAAYRRGRRRARRSAAA